MHFTLPSIDLNEFIMESTILFIESIMLFIESIRELIIPGSERLAPDPLEELLPLLMLELELDVAAEEEDFTTTGGFGLFTGGVGTTSFTTGTPLGVQTPGTTPFVSDVHFKGATQSLGE